MAVPSTARSGWGRAGHRRAVLIGLLAFAIVIGGGVAAWAAVTGSSTGYRTANVTRANIATSLEVVGTVAPVSQAAAAFQVGGKVTSLWVVAGQTVTAGETLATLDSTALSEAVSSAQSAVNADEAKLAEDEANQSGAGTSSNGSNGSNGGSSNSGSNAPSSTTNTTAPSHSGGTSSSGGQGGTGSGSDPTITQDQNTLTQDESALAKAQQQEAADLTQAQNDCASTATPTEQAACESALETVSADEQAVSTAQSTVSKDETALAQALSSAASGGSGPGSTGNSGSSSHAVANEDAFVGNTGNTGSGSGSSPGGGGSSSPSSTGGSGSSGNTDTPAQIASDQAAIDTAQANLTEAQQSLKEATLTSPISGTVVSVGISTGDTVSAGSSTEIITILGTNSYEIEATLDSSQIPSVKVGQSASVEVDGVNGSIEGTVSQVGPVQSTSSGYSYPVIVALPAISSSLMHSGSTGNVTITTGTESNVVAVPTSAVQTLNSTSYVMELSKGELTRKVIKIGMIGDSYTQVESGLSPGQSVVLVDYAEAVPSSNSNTNLSNVLGGGGGGGFFGGGGGGFFPGGGGGSFQIRNIGGGGKGG